jgi:hypothetical protein
LLPVQLLIGPLGCLEQEGKPLHYGIVVYSSLAKDDPIEFLHAAQLSVQSKSKGVCGFGVLGTRTLFTLTHARTHARTHAHHARTHKRPLTMVLFQHQGDLQASEYEFFRGTFDYLKRNNVNVNISAGRTEYVLRCLMLFVSNTLIASLLRVYVSSRAVRLISSRPSMKVERAV